MSVENRPMSVQNRQEAHDRLADAIYWFKGYAEGAKVDEDVSHDVQILAEQLRDVQDFINREVMASLDPIKEPNP